MKFWCRCKFCQNRFEAESVEVDFNTNVIYASCPECKKMNKTDPKPLPPPYPKTRRLG